MEKISIEDIMALENVPVEFSSAHYDLCVLSNIQVMRAGVVINKCYTRPLVSSTNAWKKTVNDTEAENRKKVLGLFNKISSINYEKLFLGLQEFEMKPDIIAIIFSKSIAEPSYAPLYAKLCSELFIGPQISELCFAAFNNTRTRNLIEFMVSLHSIGIIDVSQYLVSYIQDSLFQEPYSKEKQVQGSFKEEYLDFIVPFVKVIENNNNGTNCTSGAGSSKHKLLKEYLKNNRNSFSQKYKYTIMDII